VELSPQALRERMTMRGLEIDALHEAGDDYVLEVAVLSNRADLLSHLGVAREVSVLADVPLNLPDTPSAQIEGRTESFTAVEIADPDLCPRYAARVVRGVRVRPSPQWLADRLLAVGQRPVNNIADITNYVMLETGQPLHAFDLERLAERRIVVRRANAGETLRTLDGVERKLDPEMLVIADAARPVALAGVMGGADSEISDSTRDVLIESAYFSPAAVRHTARTLGMQTDASDRFERGTDYEGVVRAQARCVALICALAGGAATADALDVYPQRPAPHVVSLRLSRVSALTGLPVEPSAALRILKGLGFTLSAGGNGAQTQASAIDENALAASATLNLVSPTWRTDIKLEEDVIEEVGRHYGFEHVEDALPVANAVGEYRAHEDRRRAARHALAACGYAEAINYSFIDAAHDAQFELLPVLAARGDEGADPFVTLANPVVEGATRMRPTLLPGLLANVRHNFNHGTRDVSLFETGRIFAARGAREERPFERDAFALVATGGLREAGRAGTTREIDFYDLKGALEAALDAMQVGAVEFAPAEVRHLRAGQTAAVSLGGQVIGTLGMQTDASDRFERGTDY
ncbi:MAG TPA: phenylalanine--tRNA ligase subunit beta, partial [Pyrinomonadaceae bacterium]|nr:phenylalanine--tRNA ligase subunit beta [Pyrinomonadaceae bacterium]